MAADTRRSHAREQIFAPVEESVLKVPPLRHSWFHTANNINRKYLFYSHHDKLARDKRLNLGLDGRSFFVVGDGFLRQHKHAMCIIHHKHEAPEGHRTVINTTSNKVGNAVFFKIIRSYNKFVGAFCSSVRSMSAGSHAVHEEAQQAQ